MNHGRAVAADTISELKAFAKTIRRHVLRMTHRKGGHVGSAFSTVEVLAALYGRVLRVDPARPDDPDRDRFILSKGHGCAALYAALAERGFFPTTWRTTKSSSAASSSC